MLVSGARLLDIARQHSFAVPAFNISDWAMFRGCAEICQRRGAPWVAAIHPDELSHIGTELLPAIVATAHRSSVPIAIHLDHGSTIEQVLSAIRAGFTSVMIDGSLRPLEENIELTREVAEIAHSVGVSVEGELGTIGATESDHYLSDEILFTSPEEAVTFVNRTSVDSLAIAIGTSHGIYPKGRVPNLRLHLLEEIAECVSVPLVLHGGSSNRDVEISRAARMGISKVNISSDIKVAYHRKMRQVLHSDDLREPNQIQPPCVAEMQGICSQKIDLLGASGRAILYEHASG